jgi:predicted transposase YbfD/YdcC
MPVKGNHSCLLSKLRSVFDFPGLYEAQFEEATTTERGHGRTEVRRLRCTYDLPRHFTGFAGVRQAYRLEREVTHNKSGKVSREVVCGITSLPRLLAGAGRLLELVRGHWTIENRVHYVRDVTLGEDASQVRVGNIPQVMAAFRNAALAVLRKDGYANVAAARRYLAANPKQALRLIGCLITE